MLPAGKSGHLELGYLIGQGKPGYVLFDSRFNEDSTRWDCMYQFAKEVFFDIEELLDELRLVAPPHPSTLSTDTIVKALRWLGRRGAYD